ncbi:ABC transporter ATP-binding protein [Labilibaculum sp.]|uniref:ABC transporter ATP-binding protein n=1 Tax=Labilibaculum sp. TaxID=2060723 RepID=UPI00356A9B10
MIKLTNLSCGYGSKVILSDINLCIKEGELTCILGKNGTGKTTFFKTILGLLPALKGEILYNKQIHQQYSTKDIAKLISYVPQAHGTPFPFSVLDVVLMGQYVHTSGFFGKPQKQNIERAMHCIQSLGIEKLTRKNFSKISGGEKQMVLIARAMAQSPKFIAMDEPTANLDMGNRSKVMKLAHLLTEKGYGVLMNTHLPDQALQFANKVIMLKNGGVRRMGNPKLVLESNSLSDLYNTPIELVEAFTSNGESRKLLVTL